MSVFDPEAFLDVTIEGPSATSVKPLDPGVYPAVCAEVKIASGTVKKEGANYGKPWARLDLVLDLDVGEEKQARRTYGVMLDLDQEGNIATGPADNVRLGRARKAFGINEGNVSLRDFVGHQATAKVVTEIYEGELRDKVAAVV